MTLNSTRGNLHGDLLMYHLPSTTTFSYDFDSCECDGNTKEKNNKEKTKNKKKKDDIISRLFVLSFWSAHTCTTTNTPWDWWTFWHIIWGIWSSAAFPLVFPLFWWISVYLPEYLFWGFFGWKDCTKGLRSCFFFFCFFPYVLARRYALILWWWMVMTCTLVSYFMFTIMIIKEKNQKKKKKNRWIRYSILWCHYITSIILDRLWVALMQWNHLRSLQVISSSTGCSPWVAKTSLCVWPLGGLSA